MMRFVPSGTLRCDPVGWHTAQGGIQFLYMIRTAMSCVTSLVECVIQVHRVSSVLQATDIWFPRPSRNPGRGSARSQVTIDAMDLAPPVQSNVLENVGFEVPCS
jgi:hypothetical protein